MGYELHITRRKYYWENEVSDIPVEEWLGFIKSDPELEPYPNLGPRAARWKGKSEYPDPWLDWSDGHISSKNPDAPLINKMLQIAEKLRARVQGDDGEIYTSPSNYYHEKTSHDNESSVIEDKTNIESPPFAIGDIVVDVFGREGRVLNLDPTANNGAGEIKVQFVQGFESSFWYVAHGLEKKDF